MAKRINLLFLAISVGMLLSACTDKTEVVSEAGPEEPVQEMATEDIQLLTFDKTLIQQYEWTEDYEDLLAASEHSAVTLSEDMADEYPELAEVLNSISVMQKNSMSDEFDNLVSFAKEELDVTDTLAAKVSTLDTQIRRADSIAVSLLADSYLDNGYIREERVLSGTNYDARTGKVLELSDVICDRNAIVERIEQELYSHMWNGDLYSDQSVEEYFKDTPEDGIRWTLDYNGVTFYFTPGELAEEGHGLLTATVPFAGNEELFHEKYQTVPEAYMVRLPLNASFFTDLNGDGICEELLVSGIHHMEDTYYSAYGIYTDTDAYHYYEEIMADEFRPYYVKTANGDSYLYLFCDQIGIGDRQMVLEIIHLKKAEFTKVCERYMGPEYKSAQYAEEDVFAALTDPEAMRMDNHEDYGRTYTYRVGSTGEPERADAAEEDVSLVQTVSTTEELLNAIRSGAAVFIEPGYYNMSEFIETLSDEELADWNETHDYVKLMKCHDGREVIIQNVDHLILTSSSGRPATVEVVVDPRYAAVLTFIDCSNLELSNLIMGHTIQGDCAGNVLNFQNCQKVGLTEMDLYGCGVYGIEASQGTGEVYVYNSTIRDCSYGPLYIWDGIGNFELWDCFLTGSDGGGWFDKTEESDLYFYRCVFGENESNTWAFHEDIYTEDCSWGEITEYPDYSDVEYE